MMGDLGHAYHRVAAAILTRPHQKPGHMTAPTRSPVIVARFFLRSGGRPHMTGGLGTTVVLAVTAHALRLSVQPGIGKTSGAAPESSGSTTVGLRFRFSTAAALMLTF